MKKRKKAKLKNIQLKNNTNHEKSLMILVVLAMAFAGCHKDPQNGGDDSGGNSGNGDGNPTTGTVNGRHEWDDLGLPSGTLWATTNVGANTPDAYDDYFAWGETQPQASNTYNWVSYKYANDTYTKYCYNTNL